MKKIHRSKFHPYSIFFVFILQIFFSIVSVSVLLNMINEKNTFGIVFFSLELLLFTLLFIVSSAVIYSKQSIFSHFGSNSFISGWTFF